MEIIEKTFYKQLVKSEIDADFLLVYSDWLQEQGDPRGEIIALERILELENVHNWQGLQK